MLVIKCRRTSCTRSGLKVQWKLSWRSTQTSSCTPAVSTRSTSRTSRNRRLNVQIAENKPCTGSSCRLPCCQDHRVGAGLKIQPFAFICNPTTKEKSDWMITGWWRTLLACCKLVGEAVGRGGALQVRVRRWWWWWWWWWWWYHDGDDDDHEASVDSGLGRQGALHVKCLFICSESCSKTHLKITIFHPRITRGSNECQIEEFVLGAWPQEKKPAGGRRRRRRRHRRHWIFWVKVEEVKVKGMLSSLY